MFNKSHIECVSCFSACLNSVINLIEILNRFSFYCELEYIYKLEITDCHFKNAFSVWYSDDPKHTVAQKFKVKRICATNFYC